MPTTSIWNAWGSPAGTVKWIFQIERFLDRMETFFYKDNLLALFPTEAFVYCVVNNSNRCWKWLTFQLLSGVQGDETLKADISIFCCYRIMESACPRTRRLGGVLRWTQLNLRQRYMSFVLRVSSQQDKHHWAIYQSNLYYTFSRDKGVWRQEKEVTPGLWETFWGDDIVLQHILWWDYMNSRFRKHVNCCHVSNMYLQ